MAAVTTNGSNEDENVTRLLQEGPLGAVPGGLRVELSVGPWNAVAYESDGGIGVRGSESLCLATVSETMRQRPAGGIRERDKPSALLRASCQGADVTGAEPAEALLACADGRTERFRLGD